MAHANGLDIRLVYCSGLHPMGVMSRYNLPSNFPTGLAEAIYLVGEELLRLSSRAFRIERQRIRRGATLRPGKDTPLWNELRTLLRPRLRKYGEQANLGRLLGLPRQRINAYVTSRKQMPDAERTLQLLAWLIAVRKNQRPS
jgi:hypothetical protein